MLILLSDRALKDFSESRTAASDCLRSLTTLVGSRESLLSQNREITRLRYFTPSAWRYRHFYNSIWYRVVFTTAESKYLIIHRILQRNEINYKRDLPQHLYEGYQGHEAQFDLLDLDSEVNLDSSLDSEYISDQKYSDHSRYYHLPQNLVDTASPEELAGYILTKSYLSSPKLTSEQERLSYDSLAAQSSRFVRIQGAAGTGKSILAFHLAKNAVLQEFYPVILVPNDKLRKFGKDVIKGIDQGYQVSEKLKPQEPSDLSLLTSEEFFQSLSGSDQKVLTYLEGDKQIRRELEEKFGISLPESLQQANLYAIQQSLLEDGNQYEHNDKDGLIGGQEEAKDLLQELGRHPNFKKQFKNFSQFYGHKDSASQARQILKNLEDQDFSDSVKFEKPIALIVDEVQDYYWLQLKVIYSFLQKQDEKSLLILLGDENQRVTISGFTWSAFANSFKTSYDLPLPKYLELTRNFRNTKAIAAVAKFFLLDGFRNQGVFRNRRHPISPPDPENCFEEGLRPRLIEFDDQWLDQFTQQLKQSVDASKPENNLIFIGHEASCHYEQFKTNFEADFSSPVITLNVREAKGQEFDAVVLLSPFLLPQAHLSLNDLFTWYTSITRARRYEAILVSPEEMQWLKKNLDEPDRLTALFSISSSPNCQEFIDQLLLEGTSFLSTAERQELFIQKKKDSILNWLKNRQNPPHVTDGCQQYNLNWWNLCEEIESRVSQGLTYSQQCQIQVDDLLNEISLQDLVVLYFALRKLLPSEGDSKLIAAQIVQKLEEWSHTNPLEADQALSQIENYELKMLILRATGRSWQAAALLEENGNLDWIEEVACDLERRSLPYDAARLRARYLSKDWPRDCLQIEGSDQVEPLAAALCNHFIRVLEVLE